MSPRASRPTSSTTATAAIGMARSNDALAVQSGSRYTYASKPCAVGRRSQTRATTDVRGVRRLGAMRFRQAAGGARSPGDHASRAVTGGERVERVVDSRERIGARHQLAQLEASFLVERHQ